MRNVVFWGLFPFLLPQAMYVRKTAPRFAPAAGPDKGIIGSGPQRRLLAVGDSIIAGVGAERLTSALVGTTAEALAERLQCQVAWHAVGKTGYNSSKILDRLLPRLPDEPADFIIVSVGVNDITSLTLIPQWRSNLETLLERLSAHSPDATIAVAGIPPLRGFPLLPQPLRAVTGLRGATFDDAGREIVAGFGNSVHVPIDFHPTPERFADDGYHPSEESYAEFGQDMADSLVRQRRARIDQAP